MIPNGIANNPYLLNQTILPDYRNQRISSLNCHERPSSILPPTTSPYSYTPHDNNNTSSFLRPRISDDRRSAELELRCSTLANEVRILQEENTLLRTKLDSQASALSKMESLHRQQQDIISRLRHYENDNVGYTESLHQRNLELNNEIQNVLMDRELLATRLNEEDFRFLREKETLSIRLREREDQLFETKKRMTGLLDAKTRVEEDLSALRFDYMNLRQKAELDVKEKCLKIDNMERAFNETLQGKNEEVRHLQDRLRYYEDEIRRLRENNTMLLMTSKQEPHQQTEHNKQNRQGIDNLSRILAGEASGIKSIGKSGMKEGQLTDPSNYNYKLKQSLEEKERQLGQKNQELERLADRVKDLESRVHAVQHVPAQQTVKRPFEGEGESKVLLTMVGTIQTLRSGITKLVFDKFVVSVDHADQKKQNSLVLFMHNMNDFAAQEGHTVKHSVIAYYEAREGLKRLHTDPGLDPRLKEKALIALGKFAKYDNDFRDKVNKWIEGTLVYTIEQKRLDKSQKNKVVLFLFRLLTIKYRILYPIRGKSFKVDEDLKAVLEHKIVSAVKDFLELKIYG